MNMLFIALSYHPYIGGVEYVVKSVAERLAKHVKVYEARVMVLTRLINLAFGDEL